MWKTISFPDEKEWNKVGVVLFNSGGISDSIEQGIEELISEMIFFFYDGQILLILI